MCLPGSVGANQADRSLGSLLNASRTPVAEEEEEKEEEEDEQRAAKPAQPAG